MPRSLFLDIHCAPCHQATGGAPDRLRDAPRLARFWHRLDTAEIGVEPFAAKGDGACRPLHRSATRRAAGPSRPATDVPMAAGLGTCAVRRVTTSRSSTRRSAPPSGHSHRDGTPGASRFDAGARLHCQQGLSHGPTRAD